MIISLNKNPEKSAEQLPDNLKLSVLKGIINCITNKSDEGFLNWLYENVNYMKLYIYTLIRWCREQNLISESYLKHITEVYYSLKSDNKVPALKNEICKNLRLE